MTGPRLRHVAEVNPSTPEFDAAPDDADVTFVPLEAVWPRALDVSRTRKKAELALGYTRFCEGDVLVPKITPTFEADRSTIAVGLRNGFGAGTTELHVVRPGPSIDGRYVNYLISSRGFLLGGEAEMIGVAGQKRVPDAWLRNFHVPIQSLSAQRVTADFLDTETARIDALIAKKRRMIELLDQRDGVLIEAALSRTAVQDIPLRRLLLTLPKYGAGEAGVPGEDGWPRYIRITDLTDTGALCSEGILRLPPEVARPFLLEDGDLLLARSGATVGKAFLYRRWMGSAAFAGYLIQFRPDQEKVLPGLLEAWTRTRHYWSQVRLASLQATIENVSAEKYKDFVVPLVPRNLQEEVLAELGSRRQKSRLARAALQRQIELLQEHRQALITAAVTGHLEVPGVAA